MKSTTASLRAFAGATEPMKKIHPSIPESVDAILDVASARERRPKTWLVAEICREWAAEYARKHGIGKVKKVTAGEKAGEKEEK
jgi:hypothetical protein